MMVHRRIGLAASLALLGTLWFGGTATAQSHSKQIMAMSPAQLVELLRSSDASEFEKAKASQQLAVVGGVEAVAALVALLPDENMNIYGRFALEGIPDPAAGEALLEAATKLQGRQQVGVINSIGQRRDGRAVALLQELLGHGDAAVAAAAAGALGRIATSEASAVLAAALTENAALVNEVADASLACAEGLVAAGKTEEALSLYQAVAQAEVPKHVQVAAVGGQIAARGAGALELLLAQLRADDKAFFDVGLAAARRVPGADVTAVLADELPRLPAERQALLLRALGDRADGVPLPAVVEAAKSSSPAVREAAVVVLARRGDPAALPILMEAALGDGEVASVAQEGLKSLPDPRVDALVLERLGAADPRAKVMLLEIAAARRISDAIGVARQALTAAEEPVRLAAIAALGQLVELNDVDVLIGRAFASSETAERQAAREALRTAALRMADREAISARLTQTLGDTSQDNQIYVLEVLGRLAGPTAREAVAKTAGSSDDALKDAATRVLGDWPNAGAADTLLKIATTDREPKYQIRALRGYIRIARQLQLPDDEKLKMFRTVMEVARRPDEQQIALDILSRIPSMETLQLSVAYLDQAALKDAAADAAVKIAARLVRSDPQAVAQAMQKVVDARVTGQPGNRAKQLLAQAQGRES